MFPKALKGHFEISACVYFLISFYRPPSPSSRPTPSLIGLLFLTYLKIFIFIWASLPFMERSFLALYTLSMTAILAPPGLSQALLPLWSIFTMGRLHVHRRDWTLYLPFQLLSNEVSSEGCLPLEIKVFGV